MFTIWNEHLPNAAIIILTFMTENIDCAYSLVSSSKLQYLDHYVCTIVPIPAHSSDFRLM